MHLLDASIVNEAGIGAGASNDELGPEQLGCGLHLVIVYESCCRLQRGRQIEERERRRERQRENKEEVEEEYENIRGRVRVRRNKQHERIKKIVRYLEDQEQTYQLGGEIFSI